MPFSFLWFYSSGRCSVAMTTDPSTTIRKMSFNWTECRGWLCYDAIWKLTVLIFTDEKSSIFYILQSHWFLLEKKKSGLLEKRILCLNTLSISTFLAPNIVSTQQHQLWRHKGDRVQTSHLMICLWSEKLCQLLRQIMADQAQPVICSHHWRIYIC